MLEITLYTTVALEKEWVMTRISVSGRLPANPVPWVREAAERLRIFVRDYVIPLPDDQEYREHIERYGKLGERDPRLKDPNKDM